MWFQSFENYLNLHDLFDAYITRFNWEDLYKIITIIVLSIGSLIALSLVLRYVKRRLLGVSTDCWFCQGKQTVPYDEQNNFKCLYCDQPNGFKDDGDYLHEIPAQRVREMNSNPLAIRLKNQPLCAPSILCSACVKYQAIKQRLRNQFEPAREADFDAELKEYEVRLEEKYPLCATCELSRCHIIRRDNLRFQPYLRRQMNEKQKKRETSASKFRVVAYTMTSWLPCTLIVMALLESTVSSMYHRSLIAEYIIKIDSNLLGPKQFLLFSITVQMINLVLFVRNRFLEACLNLILSLVISTLLVLQSKLEPNTYLHTLQMVAGWVLFLLFTYLNYRRRTLEVSAKDNRFNISSCTQATSNQISSIKATSRRSHYSDSGRPATPTPSLSQTPSSHEIPDILENSMSDLNIGNSAFNRPRGQRLRVHAPQANSEIVRSSQFQGSLHSPSLSTARAMSVGSFSVPRITVQHTSHNNLNTSLLIPSPSPSIASRPSGCGIRSLHGREPSLLSPNRLNPVNSIYNGSIGQTRSRPPGSHIADDNSIAHYGTQLQSTPNDESPNSQYGDNSYTHQWLMNNGPRSPTLSDRSLLHNGSVASYRTIADPVVLSGCTWVSAVILGASLAFNLSFVLYCYAHNFPAV